MKLVFWVLATSLAGATLVAPQPVRPWELPSLRLDRKLADENAERDRRLSRAVPEGEGVETLRRLFLEHGLAESEGTNTAADDDLRQVRIFRTLESVVKEHGPESVVALRAKATEDFIEGFSSDPANPVGEETIGRRGAFVEMLERYGAMQDGVVIAPETTVRALYKARWNAIHRRPLVEGLTPIERQAYWGWLALHATSAKIELRREALRQFAEAGGSGAQEAAALFHLLDGESELAVNALGDLYDAQGEIRLRNLALGVVNTQLSQRRAP